MAGSPSRVKSGMRSNSDQVKLSPPITGTFTRCDPSTCQPDPVHTSISLTRVPATTATSGPGTMVFLSGVRSHATRIASAIRPTSRAPGRNASAAATRSVKVLPPEPETKDMSPSQSLS